jgi:hypothetical protein
VRRRGRIGGAPGIGRARSLEREAGNLGTAPRDVLLVDFRLTDNEPAAVDRLRAEHLAAEAAGRTA